MQIALCRVAAATCCSWPTKKTAANYDLESRGRGMRSHRSISKTIILGMKLTAFLILVACLHVSAKGLTQTVTLSMKNAPLEKVFVELEKQTGYHFIYAKTELQNSKPVDLNVKNGKLNDVLTICFKEQPLTYTIDDNYVVVKKKEEQQSVTQVTPPIDVHGRVVDENGNPVIATVTVKGTNKATSTDENGFFTLKNVDDNATLIISAVNIEPYEVRVNGRTDLANVTVKMKISNFDEVKVTVNTGYEQIPKERATGSFVFIDSSLINRSVSTNILDRIYGVTSGLLFMPKVNSLQLNQSNINIRGRSTITSNPNPLIVVDNFPYDGDLSTINPDDVETITVLKDAAAAAIWGAFSGNGVIVITTKKGKSNQKPTVILNTNVTIGTKPDLFYYPAINSSDEINLELFLGSKGIYSNTFFPYSITPVGEILLKRQAGLISGADSATQIDALRKNDVRNDLSKYFYRKSVNQHYDINVSGGGQANRYFFSVGLDNNHPELTYNSLRRVTVNANNSYFFLQQRLEVSTGIQFSQSKTHNNNPGFISSSVPYLKLADDNGNALAIPNAYTYRQSYIDTAGGGKLIDWNYRPLQDIRNTDNLIDLTDYHLSINAKYRIIRGLSISGLYNYNKGISNQNNFQNEQTFFVRNLINYYSQINYATGIVIRPIPRGGILDKTTNNYESNNLRGQLNYSLKWNDYSLSVLVGSELRKINTHIGSYRLYGYNPTNTSFSNVDYVGLYPDYTFQFPQNIPNNFSVLGTQNNFISYYGLSSYSYQNRYSLTFSARRDESNLFGVNTNQKGVPLYSAGALWDVSKESFYRIKWLPILHLRITDGYQGNTNSNVAAVTTMRYNLVLPNSYGATQASINNFPNQELRWEKVNQMNFAVDFGLSSNRLNGTFEYFIKKGEDLIASTPLDPSTGTRTILKNTANIKGHGFDISITSKNILQKNFLWETTFLLSYSKDEITKYLVKPSTIGSFMTADLLNPLKGKPLYSIYAYQWAGLDSLGNPRGLLDGKISSNYYSFAGSANYDNLKYIGPATPTYFGSLLNSFSYKQFSISLLITYKFGYYFRRPSVNYSNLFVGAGGISHADFANRWQRPGDEKNTNVPAMVYPLDGRDDFYSNSDILIEKGDHIRFQDVQLSYTLTKSTIASLPFQSCQFYVYANNLGIIWRANKYKIDPDYVPSSYFTYPNPKSYSFGLKIGF